MLKFLGNGSCFSTRGNTSAFINVYDKLILFDCGSTTFNTILQKNIIDDNVHEIIIFITHLHEDHIGSLSSLIMYSKYVKNINVSIICSYDVADDILDYLFITNVDFDIFTLKSFIDNEKVQIFDDNNQITNLYIEPIKVNHCDLISHAYLIYYNNEVAYYSGDANSIPNIVIDMLINNELNYLYHDVSELDYDNVHMTRKKLCEIIPKEYRNKVYCMHIDDSINENDLINDGFIITETI